MAGKKVLALTVGGSLTPLITSIKTIKPDSILFICSKGSPQEGEETLPGSSSQIPQILQETGKIHYEELLVDPDDPEDCYSQMMGKLKELKDKGWEVHADYTGGTKTMSAIFLLSAFQLHIPVYLTTAPRRGLGAIQEEPTTRRLSFPSPYYEELKTVVSSLLQRYDYAGAEDLLRSALTVYDFSSETQEELHAKCKSISAFKYWDAYDFIRAYNQIVDLRGRFQEIFSFWEKVMADRAKLEGEFYESLQKERMTQIVLRHPKPTYAIVQDLLLNAERCEKREEYDHATARVYRALEALAQFRLKTKYEINASDVKVEQITQEVRQKYEAKRKDGRIRLGLVEDYELLKDLRDEIGEKFWKEWEGEGIKKALELRNKSILAHGFYSLKEREYKERVKGVLVKFLEDCLRSILGDEYAPPSQLPNRWEEL